MASILFWRIFPKKKNSFYDVTILHVQWFQPPWRLKARLWILGICVNYFPKCETMNLSSFLLVLWSVYSCVPLIFCLAINKASDNEDESLNIFYKDINDALPQEDEIQENALVSTCILMYCR